MPVEDCQAGSWINAQHYAISMSRDHGYAIIVNGASGQRYGYANGVPVSVT